MSAPDSIHQLVDRFEEQRGAYHAGKYNETQLRSDFLNPFFEALGWDVLNHKGYAERYREVMLEQSVEVEGQAKAADYAFRVGDKTLFFVEAKKPAVNIAANPEPAFQVRRYGWSAKLSLSLLSDFEQLAVYDCRSKPKHSDPAACERVELYSFREYSEKWDEISARFSREAVLKGSFDQFAERMKGKKGTADVDDAFLEEMEHWREDLAHNIALRNLTLSQRELNSAVQTTIDRMIFLRICEERGIEAEDALHSAAEGKNVYENLVSLFKQADKKYNSGLFHFYEEKKQSSYPDRLTLRLQIDDKVLKDILAHLYYPLSPYAFKYIPTDILGQVYERFLGKVIRLTAGHQARVEEKPEVRKAGGVYYTPTYIVEYIVKHTLGELLKDQTAESQKNQPLRVLDPACGSGSFLLGAYQYLLDWYLDWYIHNDPGRWAKGKAPAVVEGQGGWQLTMDKKKEILLSHIFGVDIDAQAVEVTKLSLLLSVVESPGQLSWLNERILPDLGENIQCGNSLIGPDYYDNRQMPMFGDEEFYRVNPFDWQKAFSQVFAAGGFDAVIGNPPYVRSINLKESDPKLWDLYRTRYKSASAREWDIYLIFVEKGLDLLNQFGKLGYILPNKFLNSKVGENLRQILSSQFWLEELVHFGAFQVFENVTTYTCLLFLCKGNNKSLAKIARYTGEVNKFGICPMPETAPEKWKEYAIPRIQLNNNPWEFSASSIELLEKIRKRPTLQTFFQVYKGTGTDADKVFLMEDRGKEGEFVRVFSNATQKEYLLEATLLKPAFRGRHISRYTLTEKPWWLIVPYSNIQDKPSLLDYRHLLTIAPKTMEYLRECKDLLDEREKGRFVGSGWYCFGRPQNMNRFEVNKILFPDVVNRGECYYDNENNWILDTAYAITNIGNNQLSLLYLMGILNSPLLTYFLQETGTALRGGYFRMKTAYLNPFPIRVIDFSDPADAARHAHMVTLVESMLALHKQAATARMPQDKEMIQRQIEATDAQIDRLVYELYGLTEEEIKIVEGG